MENDSILLKYVKENEKLKHKNKMLECRLDIIELLIIDPLNDNYSQFTNEQLKFFFEIEKVIKGKQDIKILQKIIDEELYG